jgi:hypothetical protein
VRIGFNDLASDGIDQAVGEREVPPWPPAEVLEARLAAGGTNGLYLDLRSPGAGSHDFEMIWQAGSGGYPVTLAWNPDLIPEGFSLTISDNLDGSFIGPIDMGSISSVTVQDCMSFITGVRVTASVSGAGTKASASITKFDLRQNVPNPFSRETSIVYDLPNKCVADVSIYDASGRKVRVLTCGNQQAGRHTLAWDGRDEAGSGVSAGVYFCRMQAEDYTKIRKILLVR